MKDLITLVEEYIRKESLLPAEQVVIGVSAGADSMALLYVLTDICRRSYPSTKLLAAHLHHGIRDKEADEDEKLVREFCKKLDVPLEVRKLDIPAISKEKKTSLETQGRLERYAFFRELLQGKGYIAVAHHMDDQAESIAMHIFRGCGMEGLLGMQPRHEDVIRPFLELRKCEILDFCLDRAIPFRDDSTNADSGYARNFWRNELFPRIDRGVHMSPVEALNGLSLRIREENEYLEKVAERALSDVLDEEGEAVTERLNRLEPPILRRVLRKLAVSAFGDVVDMEACHWDALMEILRATGAARNLDLPGGRKALAEHGILRFLPSEEETGTQESGYVPGIGACVFGEDTSFVLPLRDLPLGEIVNFSQSFVKIRLVSIEKEDEVVYNDTTWFFPESMVGKAVLRTRRKGDTLHRAGSSVTKELRRFMTEVRFPVRFRDKVLLVMEDSRTLWFPGYAHAVGFTDPLSREKYGKDHEEKLFKLEFLPQIVDEGGLDNGEN